MFKKSGIFKVNKGHAPEPRGLADVPDFSYQNAKLNSEGFRIVSTDVSGMDLSQAGRLIKYIRFNNNVKWPGKDNLPPGFDPQAVLEKMKNPGLGIRALHERGITGKGITVAILDQELDTEHQEIKDNLVHYEDIGFPPENYAAMHGSAVSSILVGKTVGVAPAAKLVYFAPTFRKNGVSFTDNYKTALKKILFMNEGLPEDEKISVVSISWGELAHDNEVLNLIKQLQDKGVFVITTGLHKTHGLQFATADRDMNGNPDDAANYDAGDWWKDRKDGFGANNLMIPAGGITTAAPNGHDQYVYYGAGAGASWATPWVAGMFALAKQVDKNITPERFWNMALATGVPVEKDGKFYGKIIQPEKIISKLEQEMARPSILIDKQND